MVSHPAMLSRVMVAGALWATLVYSFWPRPAAAQGAGLETYVCEGEEEAFADFKDDLRLDAGYEPPPDIISVKVETGDERTLYGYMAKARNAEAAEVPAQGYILILPGNAMYAQHLIPVIRGFATLGYDVYVYDYRGYGRSGGRSAVRALIEDAKEIVAHLGRPTANGGKGYAKRNVYGLSAGAAIAINSFADDSPIDRLVLDGTPASISLDGWFVPDMKCPPELDPVKRLIPLAQRSLLINSGRDRILRITQDRAVQKQFVENARKAGVCVVDQPKFGHPLQDRFTVERMVMVARFVEETPQAACQTVRSLPKPK